MESLSKGFCTEALTAALTNNQQEAWHAKWRHPTLQVVDILRYPKHITPETETSRFYLALSDAKTLIWGVIPPGIDLEEAITKYHLDVGCFLRIRRYEIVVAANGLNVLVILHASFSSDPLSLLGFPEYDETLFELSPRALRPSHGGFHSNFEDLTTSDSFFSSENEIVLRDLIDQPGCLVAKPQWWVALRIVWKRRERYAGRTTRSAHANSNSRGRYASTAEIFSCVGVDANGDAIPVYFSLINPSLIACVEPQGCLQASHGSVNWGPGEPGLPSELHFREEAVIRKITDSARAGLLPAFPRQFIGSFQRGLRSLKEIIEEVALDEVISLEAVVRRVDGGAMMHTKHGQVLRVIIEVEQGDEDEETRKNGRGFSSPILNITLWGTLAEQIEAKPGERWCFANCTVREFMRRKTLSSRSNSFAIRMHHEGFRATFSQQVSHLNSSLPEERSNPTEKKDKGGSDTHPTTAPMMERPLRLTWSFHETSSTLPALVRIESIETPLTRLVCARCREPREAVKISTSQLTVCEYCKESHEIRESFYVALHLSDAMDSIRAVGHTAIGESLFGISESEFISQKKTRSEFEKEVCRSLTGSPIAIWLLGNFNETQLLICCRHINLSLSSTVLLSAIDNILDNG